MCAQLPSHVQFVVTLRPVDLHAPLSMEFFRKQHWSGLPFPPPGDLTQSPKSPALQADSAEPSERPSNLYSDSYLLAKGWG